MAYYDEFVKNPDAALRDIAERRNISPAELGQRVDLIASEAQSGAHLTLGQAKSYFANNNGGEIAAHVDSCPYCKAMLDGLSPSRIDANIEALQGQLRGRSRASASPATAVSLRSKFWLQHAALSLVIVLTSVGAVDSYVSYRQQKSFTDLQSKFDLLEASNLTLSLATNRLATSNKQLLAALTTTDAVNFKLASDTSWSDGPGSVAGWNTSSDVRRNWMIGSKFIPFCTADTLAGIHTPDKHHDDSHCTFTQREMVLANPDHSLFGLSIGPFP